MTSPVPPAAPQQIRMANFVVSSSLAKPHEMPNWKKWRVCSGDRDIEGPVLLYLRHKGWLFDRILPLESRQCVLTRRGHFLIYTSEDQGFVLDLRTAKEFRTNSDAITVDGQKITRCRVKVRFAFGTLNLVLNNEKIDKWRDALLTAVETIKNRNLDGVTPLIRKYVSSKLLKKTKLKKTKKSKIPKLIAEAPKEEEEAPPAPQQQMALYHGCTGMDRDEFNERMYELSCRPAGTTFAMLDEEEQRFIAALFRRASMTNLYDATASEHSSRLAITSSETMVEVPDEEKTVDSFEPEADKDPMIPASLRIAEDQKVAGQKIGKNPFEDDDSVETEVDKDPRIPVSWLARRIESRIAEDKKAAGQKIGKNPFDDDL